MVWIYTQLTVAFVGGSTVYGVDIYPKSHLTFVAEVYTASGLTLRLVRRGVIFFSLCTRIFQS